jgi:hypothetical protein
MLFRCPWWSCYATTLCPVLASTNRRVTVCVTTSSGFRRIQTDDKVFHAGSCKWVAALSKRDALIERVTANVLARYLKGAS